MLLQPPHTTRRVDVVLAATLNQTSSGQRRACSTSPIKNYNWALMLCPSVLSAVMLMGNFYTLNAMLYPPHTTRRQDVVLAATPNQTSSGLRRGCSISTIDNDVMALMLCPSVLPTPTLMGLFYTLNAILQSQYTIRRENVVLAAFAN